MTVGALLTRLAEAHPEHEALVYPDRRWTFAALEDEAKLIARGLLASGVKPGDRVALWATNVPEWVILQFALAKVGAILVTVNTSLRARELDYLLRQSEVSTLITIRGFKSVDYLEELRQLDLLSGTGQAKRDAATEPIRLQRIIFIGDDGHDALLPYAKLRAQASQVDEATLDACSAAVTVDDVINMQYTSGTTGFPKGVMLSSRNIVNNGYWLAQGVWPSRLMTASVSACRFFIASGASSACWEPTPTGYVSVRSSGSRRGRCDLAP